jgi:hypothetical protein
MRFQPRTLVGGRERLEPAGCIVDRAAQAVVGCRILDPGLT